MHVTLIIYHNSDPDYAPPRASHLLSLSLSLFLFKYHWHCHCSYLHITVTVTVTVTVPMYISLSLSLSLSMSLFLFTHHCHCHCHCQCSCFHINLSVTAIVTIPISTTNRFLSFVYRPHNWRHIKPTPLTDISVSLLTAADSRPTDQHSSAHCCYRNDGLNAVNSDLCTQCGIVRRVLDGQRVLWQL